MNYKKVISFTQTNANSNIKQGCNPNLSEVEKPTSKFIIIDDDDRDIMMTLDMLKASHINVSPMIYNDPTNAVAELSSIDYEKSGVSPPDLILIDFNMPKMNGLQVLEALKKIDNLKNIPIFLLTNQDQDEIIIEASKCKATGFLNKPLDTEAFKKILQD